MATNSITQSCHREHAAERFFVIHQDAEEWFSSGKPVQLAYLIIFALHNNIIAY